MAINTKTFLSKCNTIIKDSSLNTGLNPILELNYGKMITRILIYFDHTKVQKMVEDKIYPDVSKLKHVLRMTNMASINDRGINCKMMDSTHNHDKERAISFDVIYFLIPNEWDAARGFDYAQDLYNGSHRGTSMDGCNWYQYRNYCRWGEEGVYTTEHLSKEVDLFTSFAGNKSTVIIGYQHFDRGNEPIEFDITETFNKFITGELCNYGIGIAFSPAFEQTETKLSQYVGFFGNHTNSFYEPYVETTYDEIIRDDRSNFYLNKDNRLYFYASVGGKSVNLDKLPTFTLNGVQSDVKQATRGVYYAEVNLSSEEYESDTMYYDVWSDIVYNGKQIDDVELYFTTKAKDRYFSFGLPATDSSVDATEVIPSISGISHHEQVKQGDVRKLTVDCRIPYTSEQQYAVDGIEYRLYTKEGEKEIDVIQYSPVEIGYNSNYFYIKTSELVPSRYFIDIKISYDMEVKYHYDVLEFDIVNDRTYIFN